MRKPYTRYDEYNAHLLMEEERQKEALKAFMRRERQGWKVPYWLQLSVGILGAALAVFVVLWLSIPISEWWK